MVYTFLYTPRLPNVRGQTTVGHINIFVDLAPFFHFICQTSTKSPTFRQRNELFCSLLSNLLHIDLFLLIKSQRTLNYFMNQ